jgi:hypothetical protein
VERSSSTSVWGASPPAGSVDTESTTTSAHTLTSAAAGLASANSMRAVSAHSMSIGSSMGDGGSPRGGAWAAAAPGVGGLGGGFGGGNGFLLFPDIQELALPGEEGMASQDSGEEETREPRRGADMAVR